MSKIIICGFDYETTKKMVNKYIAHKRKISVIYLTDEVWRNDSVLCHVINEYDDICPYIFKGEADEIDANTPTDALAYIDWIKDGGKVTIHTMLKEEIWEKSPQLKAYKYLQKLEGSWGIVLRIIH